MRSGTTHKEKKQNKQSGEKIHSFSKQCLTDVNERTEGWTDMKQSRKYSYQNKVMRFGRRGS